MTEPSDWNYHLSGSKKGTTQGQGQQNGGQQGDNGWGSFDSFDTVSTPSMQPQQPQVRARGMGGVHHRSSGSAGRGNQQQHTASPVPFSDGWGAFDNGGSNGGDTNLYPPMPPTSNSFASSNPMYGSPPPSWGSEQAPLPPGGAPSYMGFGGNQGANQNFQNFAADPVFNAARQIGGQFAEQQREKFSRYVSSLHLKYYFAVDTSYVVKKLAIILFPFFHRDWQCAMATGDRSGGEPVPARADVNAPDLYIPLMAFITYVLVAGFVLGTQKRFSPEQLGMLTTNALFYTGLENVLVFGAKYLLNISQSLNVWQSLSYTSYKYVGMVVCLLLYLCAGSSVYYAGLVYCIVATIFFLLRSLKTFILDAANYNALGQDGGRKRKLYLLLSITVFQSLVMWLLTSSVTSYMPHNYDFAKMAMSGIGIGGSAAMGGGGGGHHLPANVPRLPDGEVDYEALLKMP